MPSQAASALPWPGHLPIMSAVLEQLHQLHAYADVTLVCDDGHLLLHSPVLPNKDHKQVSERETKARFKKKEVSAIFH